MSQADGDYCRRALPRWHTRFGRVVGEIGVPRILAALHGDPDLRVTKQAVYAWLAGFEPRPDRARALVKLAGGKLDLEMIYSHKRELDKLRRDRAAEGDPEP